MSEVSCDFMSYLSASLVDCFFSCGSAFSRQRHGSLPISMVITRIALVFVESDR